MTSASASAFQFSIREAKLSFSVKERKSMTSLCAITQRRVFRKVAAALFAIAGMAACANADTIGPGNSLEATFTTAPNSSDLLLFFSGDGPLTTTGSPVVSVELFNGASLLGTFTENVSALVVINAWFESPVGQYTGAVFDGPAPTPVSFTSINNGSIAGELLLTVTGGTITFNESKLVFYDAVSAPEDAYYPKGDVQNISYAVTTTTTTTTPEPVSGMLVTGGLTGLWLWKRRRSGL